MSMKPKLTDDVQLKGVYNTRCELGAAVNLWFTRVRTCFGRVASSFLHSHESHL